MARNRRRDAPDPITVPASVVDKLDTIEDPEEWRSSVREILSLLSQCGCDDPSGALAAAGWTPETFLRRALGAPPRKVS